MEGPRTAISVVMPLYNGAAFLGRAIQSLRAQSLADWELLAVDDGSTDDGYGRLCRHAAADARIRPFCLDTNRGPSAARNVALRRARGAIITYLDCDDEYYPDYLDNVRTWQGRTDVLVSAIDIVEPGKKTPRTWDATPWRASWLRECLVNPLAVAHRRALLERIGLFAEELFLAEDWDMWKRLARAGATFLYLPLKSGRYHVRADSLFRRRRGPEREGG